ncbi:hypothetical protein P4S72_13955 [Vibrio sp. PP-XX7]
MKIVTDAPGLASSINIGAFNLGNAAGAALGGLVITLEFWLAGFHPQPPSSPSAGY